MRTSGRVGRVTALYALGSFSLGVYMPVRRDGRTGFEAPAAISARPEDEHGGSWSKRPFPVRSSACGRLGEP
jgi:hypothetical protein